MNESKPITIAIAEDHDIVRAGLKMIIDSFGGFKVTIEAGDGAQLLRQLQTATLLPDICILDIRMPKSDGFDTLTEIRRFWPGMKVLAVSMFHEDLPVLRMMRLGANGYITKSSAPSVLREALLKIYEGENYYRDELVASDAYWDGSGKIMGLTEEELVFLSHCASDLSYKEIAVMMNKSERTIEGYASSLCHKLNIKTRVGLGRFALNAGLST